MNGAALRFTDVECRRGGRTLFSGFGLTLRAGGSAIVRGPNGTGKSSLIRLAAGLLLPARGHIERSGGLAMSDENTALDMNRALADALGHWARIDGARAGAVEGALEALALAHLAAIPVRMLSTGQRKRAMLARVAASGAAIWLLDEPANGLDVEAQRLLGALMARHVGSGGIILAASHQPIALTEPQIVDLTDYAPGEAAL